MLILGLLFFACGSEDTNPDPSDVAIEEIEFNIPIELENYYGEVVFATDKEVLFRALRNVSKDNHNVLFYSERHNYLYEVDEDASATDHVVLMYTGESRYWEEYTSGNNSYSPQTFNTEHVYPQSLYVNDNAEGDLHHLRACDAGVNEQRSNYPFTDGSGNAALQNTSWFPGDEWKGDVARMIMYLNVRYGESFARVGNLELFLQWNAEDGVSEFEIQRNERIENAQGNRNPFIDNPYLATLIWGGDKAENRWE